MRFLRAFTGEVFTNPTKLDVDHFIPLAHAFASGGHAWSADQRRAFANELADTEHLVAVKAGANRSKGKRGPDKWLPPMKSYRCEYLTVWVHLKAKWKLAVSSQEEMAIERLLRSCADQR